MRPSWQKKCSSLLSVCHSPKIFTSLSHQERRAPQKTEKSYLQRRHKKRNKIRGREGPRRREEEKKRKKKKKKEKLILFYSTHFIIARAFSLSLSCVVVVVV